MRYIRAPGGGHTLSAVLRRNSLAIEAIFLLLVVAAITIAANRDGIANRAAPLNVPASLPGQDAEIGEAYIMINTDGTVVQLLSTPGGDSLRSWPNGTRMTVVSPEMEVDQVSWTNVQDPEGNVGWVPSRYCYTWLPGGWAVR